MSRRKWPVVGVLLAILWLFVRGVQLTVASVIGEFIIGLTVGLPIAYGSRRLYLERIDVLRSLSVIPTAVRFVVLFLWEVLTANVDVAYRVLHPRMPIEPDVVEVPLRVESDAAITTIANSITLTPGTLTMDHDPDTNTLYVHGIIGRRRDEVLKPIRRWEDLLLVCFDEPASPESVPPTPPSRLTGTDKSTAPAGETVESDGGGDDNGT